MSPSQAIMIVRRELLDAHAIGNQDRVSAHESDERSACFLADGDAAAKFLHGGLGDVIASGEHTRPVMGGVPGGDQRPPRSPAGEYGKARGQGFVNMDDVELTLADPCPHASRGFHTETQTRNRTVVGNGDRASAVGHPVGDRGFFLHRGENVH